MTNEPVQIVEFQFPRCGNVCGTAPCAATFDPGRQCYNTRATCLDPLNYRESPDDHLAADFTARQGDTILNTDLTRNVSIVAAIDVDFPAVPVGTIWEQGGSGTGTYLGITAGELAFSAGEYGSTDKRLTVPLSSVAGKSLTIFATIDLGPSSGSRVMSLHAFDPVNRELTELAIRSDIAFSFWAGDNPGGVGFANDSIGATEDGGTFNGRISSARFYSNRMSDFSLAADTAPETFRARLLFDDGRDARPLDVRPIPMLAAASSSASKINLSGSRQAAGPLGNYGTATIGLADGPHSDRGIDPYRSARPFDPGKRSTLWRKLEIRERLGAINARVRIIEGNSGQRLDQMAARSFILDKLEVDVNGSVSASCRSILALSNAREALAPAASPGFLAADITAAATSFSVAGAQLSDYQPSGSLRINDEVMTYSAVAQADDLIAFTITARGTDGTTAQDHAAEDGVQECLRIVSLPVDQVAELLITRFTSIPSQYLNLSAWKTETEDQLGAYLITALITEPTSVSALLGALTEETSSVMWFDERLQTVELRAIRPLSDTPVRLTDEAHFVADSISVRRRPESRISTLIFYFGLRNPAAKRDEVANYNFVHIEKSPLERYAGRSIRQIFSIFLTARAVARQTAGRIITRFEETPIEIGFQLHAKDSSLNVGDFFQTSSDDIILPNGDRDLNRIFIVTSARVVLPDEIVEYTAEDATLVGIQSRVVANDTPDYDGSGGVKWITNAAGVNPDGTRGARIS